MKVTFRWPVLAQWFLSDAIEGTGLCFIGKRKFSRFISQYIPDNVGVVKSIETDEIIGEHRGLHLYTLGQRISPLNSQTRSSSEPFYIASKDHIGNIIYVVRSISLGSTVFPALSF